MAPLLRLLALLALSAPLLVLASPHFSRHAYGHAHRAIARPQIDIVPRDPLPVPRRARSLNKRCVPRPSNSTSSTSSTPVPTAPINVAPAPSSSTPVPSSSAAPSPPVPSPSPTTSSPPPAQTSPAAASGSSQPSYLVGPQTGQATYYAPGLGACGFTNSSTDHIAAVSQYMFDSYPGYDGVNPNTNPVCHRTITLQYQGKSVTVEVVDRCVDCKTTDLDLSPSAFDALADAAVGRINMNWNWD